MIVSEHDADITAQHLTLERDGAPMSAYYAVPNEPGEALPTVVLAIHIWGVDAGYRDTVRRLAKAGFAAIVPDLYARFDAPDGDVVTDYREFIPFAQRLTPETVDADITASVRWLQTQFPRSKMAIAGFCMGGVMAMNRTVGYKKTFSAAAVWYGLKPEIDPHDVEIPIVASYGADDKGIPVENVNRFQAGLTVPNDFKIYPNAQHAFFDHTRAAYNAEAADDSWQRAIAFLHKYLGA
jgi:carboxymethylenebutenolidase